MLVVTRNPFHCKNLTRGSEKNKKLGYPHQTSTFHPILNSNSVKFLMKFKVKTGWEIHHKNYFHIHFHKQESSKYSTNSIPVDPAMWTEHHPMVLAYSRNNSCEVVQIRWPRRHRNSRTIQYSLGFPLNILPKFPSSFLRCSQGRFLVCTAWSGRRAEIWIF